MVDLILSGLLRTYVASFLDRDFEKYSFRMSIVFCRGIISKRPGIKIKLL